MSLDDMLNNRGLGAAQSTGGYSSSGEHWSETTETTAPTQTNAQPNATANTNQYDLFITDFGTAAQNTGRSSRSGNDTSGRGIVISDGTNVWRQPLTSHPGNNWTLPDAADYNARISNASTTAAAALDYWLSQHPFYEVNGAMPSDLQALYNDFESRYNTFKSHTRDLSSANEPYELKKARQDFNNAVIAYANLKYTQALQAGKLLTLQEALAAGDPKSKVFYVKPGYYYIGNTTKIAPTVSTDAATTATTNASQSQAARSALEAQQYQNTYNANLAYNTSASGQTSNSNAESDSAWWLLLPLAALGLAKIVSKNKDSKKRKKR